jgi:hypothetical protein
MWASRAVAVGYKWKVGDGRSIKFWEDIWFGNSPLATQFWDIYIISNQQTQTIRDLWDGEQIRGTFRRIFSEEMMTNWLELIEIAKTISFTDENDQLIWQYETNGIYSSSSMYALVNFRGIQPIYLPSVWKLKIPPRIQVFLWLFSQNKIMTRDNLRHRGMVKPLECEMCKELETVKHLMFDCIVARQIWSIVENVFDCKIDNFESVASKWLCNKKFLHFNLVTSATLWGLWINRNNLVFNKTSWINIKQVWRLVLSFVKEWKGPFKELEGGRSSQFLDCLLSLLRSRLPLPSP